MSPEQREQEIHAASKAYGLANMRIALATKQRANAIKRLRELYLCVTCDSTGKILEDETCPSCGDDEQFHLRHTIDYQRNCQRCWGWGGGGKMAPAAFLMIYRDRNRGITTCSRCAKCAEHKSSHSEPIAVLPFKPMEGM